MSKRKANLIGLTAFAIIIAVIALFPRTRSADQPIAGAPPTVGEMRYFDLAKVRLARPNISWKRPDGTKISLSDFDGKVVLLNYWASWCAPCLRELPSLDRLAASFEGENFKVIALNVDPEGEPLASATAKRLNLKTLKLNLDPGLETYRTIGVRVMPSTFLFDRNGDVLGVFRGGTDWDSLDAKKLFNYFIDRPDYASKLKKFGT